jgi:O-antigen/teichoic acid export membrane protein
MAQLIPNSLAFTALWLLNFDGLAFVTFVYSMSYMAAGLATMTYVLVSHPLHSQGKGPTDGDLIRFGVRGMFGSVSPLEAFRPDHLIVGAIAGPTALGLYVVGVAFSNLPRFVAVSVGMIAYAQLAAAHERLNRLVLQFLIVAILFGGTIVLILEPFVGTLIEFFFGSEFAGATPITRVMLVAALLTGLKRLLGDCARGLGQPEAGTLAEVVAWLVMLPLAVILTQKYGGLGAAWSLLAAGAASVAVSGILMIRRLAKPAPRDLPASEGAPASQR